MVVLQWVFLSSGVLGDTIVKEILEEEYDCVADLLEEAVTEGILDDGTVEAIVDEVVEEALVITPTDVNLVTKRMLSGLLDESNFESANEGLNVVMDVYKRCLSSEGCVRDEIMDEAIRSFNLAQEHTQVQFEVHVLAIKDFLFSLISSLESQGADKGPIDVGNNNYNDMLQYAKLLLEKEGVLDKVTFSKYFQDFVLNLKRCQIASGCGELTDSTAIMEAYLTRAKELQDELHTLNLRYIEDMIGLLASEVEALPEEEDAAEDVLDDLFDAVDVEEADDSIILDSEEQ